MSILDIYRVKESPGEEHPYDVMRKSRQEVLKSALKEERFDIVVAGGGVQGAAMARLAAFNGLSVLLLEINDYASGTSSRTSKMAHGGLRYLEQLDFTQVMQGVRAREELYTEAPHLVSAHKFLIPVFKGKWFQRIKLWCGLTLYNLFLRKIKLPRFHRGESSGFEMYSHEGKPVHGYYEFSDGIMHDTRLVLEMIFAARQEGAVCLNHARVDSVAQKNDYCEVSWTDQLTGNKHTIKAGLVVNTAGPWAVTLGRLKPDRTLPPVRYSRGSHLLFDKPWNKPAVLIPRAEKGRNYFVWPHFAGTLVGTTERELGAPDFDPLPDGSEIDELLGLLQKNFPSEGFGKGGLIYAYSGIRTLVGKQGSTDTSKLSRRHIWNFSGGILTLLGGKYTTAKWTAFDGLQKVFALSGQKRKVAQLSKRALPGAYRLTETVNDFLVYCRERQVPESVSRSAIRRLGSRCRLLKEIDPSLRVIDGKVFWADLVFALEYEQAETLADIISRRLDLEYEEERGLSVLCSLCFELEKLRPETNWPLQAEAYRKHIEDLIQKIRS